MLVPVMWRFKNLQGGGGQNAGDQGTENIRLHSHARGQ